MGERVIEIDFNKRVRIPSAEPVHLNRDQARQELKVALRQELVRIKNFYKIGESAEDFLKTSLAMTDLIYEIRTFLDGHNGYGEALFGDLEDDPLAEAIATLAKEMVREYFQAR
ncbi:MAG: hypothetical protein WC575_04935 [Patescibacteria group bacterium]